MISRPRQRIHAGDAGIIRSDSRVRKERQKPLPWAAGDAAHAVADAGILEEIAVRQRLGGMIGSNSPALSSVGRALATSSFALGSACALPSTFCPLHSPDDEGTDTQREKTGARHHQAGGARRMPSAFALATASVRLFTPNLP